VFPNPDALDVTRSPNPHVAYGHGTHECVAEWLARVELQEALRGLFSRVPGLRLAVAPEELQWSSPTADVGLAKLPVTW
jgi:cytochrome P450